MAEQELMLVEELVTEFTRSYGENDAKWYPLARGRKAVSSDYVLFVVGSRRENIRTGVVTYDWKIRLQSRSGAYTLCAQKIEYIDLVPLITIFKELGWDTATLTTKGTNHE